jgi:ABC-2 type transport system ATP-binding protein
VVAVLGSNGSGKTTLLRIVAQLLEPTAGTVEVCGANVTGDRADDVRLQVGFAPHRPLAYEELSVRGNLIFAGRLAGKQKLTCKLLADTAIERFGLTDNADEPVGKLSRGWQQRYALARADLLEPPILLLDEPTTGLDDEGREATEQHLAQWRTNRIVLMATHERDWIAPFADSTLELDGVE